MKLSNDITAVEVGCGTGANGDVLTLFDRTVGLDTSRFALAKCGEGHRFKVQGDLMHLPMKPHSVDLVLALDILEHLDDDERAVREIRQVLKPEGMLLAFVPAFEFLWGAQDDLSHHKRRYTRSRLSHLLESNGFDILRLTFFNIYFFLPILVIRKILRWTGRPLRSENEYTAPWLNRLLAPIFASEGLLLEHMDLPVGVSLIAVARKPSA